MHIERAFESVEAFLRAANARSEMPSTVRASRRKSRFEFTHTNSYTEALNLARGGWPEGAAMVRALSTDIVAVVGARVQRPETSYALCGDTIDMGRFLIGEPECFMEFTPSEVEMTGTKIVRIVANYAASAGVAAEVLRMRGAAICALAEALEYGGRRCEIVAVQAIRGRGGDSYQCSVIVKEAQQPLDLDRIAFALCHPSMLRRLTFSLEETESAEVREALGVPGGYGHPTDTTLTGEIVLEKAHSGDPAWRSLEAAKGWVLQQLAAQGVMLRAA